MLRWIIPPALTLMLYWPGLLSWFQKDDFAWLGLYDMIHDWPSFWDAMFHPYAQGTVRTFSERVIYTSFYALFGMHSLPYRILAFLTYFASLTLIQIIGARLTESKTVGFWAAILWTLNANMAFALAWMAIYYELACALTFLAALWLLMRYAETGAGRYLIVQWIVYLTGFGVLELNVVYPAIALAYAWLFARHVIGKIWPMFIPAILYSIAHILAAPMSTSGPYKMYWDAAAPSTLWTYWKLILGPSRLIYLGWYPSTGRSALAFIMTTALLGYLFWAIRKRRWTAVFGAAWFVLVLAPLLPLRNHITDYYLTIPLVGFALWGATAITEGWRSGRLAQFTVLVTLSIYAGVNIPLAWVNVKSFQDRSLKLQTMIERVVRESHTHPGAPLVLRGVEPDLFWSGIWHRPFRLYGLHEIYVDSSDRAGILQSFQGADPSSYFPDKPPPGARVLDVSGGQVRDVTPSP